MIIILGKSICSSSQNTVSGISFLFHLCIFNNIYLLPKMIFTLRTYYQGLGKNSWLLCFNVLWVTKFNFITRNFSPLLWVVILWFWIFFLFGKVCTLMVEWESVKKRESFPHQLTPQMPATARWNRLKLWLCNSMVLSRGWQRPKYLSHHQLPFLVRVAGTHHITKLTSQFLTCLK